jgi:hypothetical protein
LSTAVLVAGGSALAVVSPAFATPAQFTAGDLVVYQVTEASGAPSSTAGSVSLVDYAPSGTPSGYAVALPTANSGSTHALVESGTATNDGDLTLSGDGQYLYVSGYDDAPGTVKITSTTPAPPRTVGIVSATGVVDTSTALSDSTTEANNFRSAAGPTGGTSNIYDGGGAGVGITSDGATSNTFLDTTDNVHEVQIVNGNLYASTTKNIVQIGTGLPTSGTPTVTSLIASPPTGFSANGFAFATLGSGSTPDTLYVADTGNSAVEKYSYTGSTWALSGSVSVADATGIAVSVTGGVASIYTTNAPTGSSNTYATELSELTDTSGAGGTLPSNTTVNTLATAGASSSFHGLAFAPVATPVAATPETSVVLALPVLAAVMIGGAVVYRRRHHAA